MCQLVSHFKYVTAHRVLCPDRMYCVGFQDTSSRHGDDSSDDTFTDGDGGLSEEDTVAVK
jgi:hypothetical protein